MPHPGATRFAPVGSFWRARPGPGRLEYTPLVSTHDPSLHPSLFCPPPFFFPFFFFLAASGGQDPEARAKKDTLKARAQSAKYVLNPES